MTTDILKLEKEDNYYLITGKKCWVSVYDISGDVTLVMGMKGAIPSDNMKGFSLDQKTNELFLEFYRGQRKLKLEKILLGKIADYDQTSSWVDKVNSLYRNK